MGACQTRGAMPLPTGGGQREVHLTLVRDGNVPLGVRLTLHRAGVLLRGVDEGSAMARWNAEHPSMEVAAGDMVVSVNGVAADSTWSRWGTILAEFRKNTVTVVVHRDLSRPRLHGPSPPSSSLDQLLPDSFLESMDRDLASALHCEECAICLDELGDGSDVVVLPCRHAFHYACADRWLAQCPTLRHATCPTCRTRIPFNAGAAGRATGKLAVLPEAAPHVHVDGAALAQGHRQMEPAVNDDGAALAQGHRQAAIIQAATIQGRAVRMSL